MDPAILHPTSAQHTTEPLASAQPALDTPHQTTVINVPFNEEDENSSASTAVNGTPTNDGLNTVSRFHQLPDELLDHILGYLVHDSAKLLPFDRRASLSTESFASAPPHIPEDTINLNTFRSLCVKFLRIGRSRLFARENIRSSKEGFKRIHDIAQDSKVAKKVSWEVKKISYMVHDFYPQNAQRLQEILNDARFSTANSQQRLSDIQASHTSQNSQSTLAVRRLNAELVRCRRNEQIILRAMARAEEQRQIMEGKIDEEALIAALAAFKNLQQIRLMRNVDDHDRDWGDFLDSNSDLRREFGTSQWTFACERATMVLGRAYLASKSMAHRLSSRFMDPRPSWLQEYISEEALSSLSTRLTCLELQIDDPYDLNEKMNQLSGVFRTLFQAAKKMEGLHIGLRRQISIPLETIFHNITWPNLLYIGFSRWNLTSDQIIDFIRRHRSSLKSVRFREIRLREGQWIEIVQFLRQELKLKWVSFRQVGYDPRIGGGPVPETGYGGGFAMLRGPPMDEDYSSESSDDIGERAGTGHGTTQLAEEDETNPSEDESAAPDNDSDETVEAVDLGINDMIQSVSDDQEAIMFDSNESASSINRGAHSDESEESPSGSVAGDSEVGVVNEVAFDDQMMVQHSSATDEPMPDCDCGNGYAWSELEDDYGLDPTKPQWKRWERWVVRGCSEHDPRAS